MASTIPGIQHSCFRWCERCPFTDRCSLFAMTADFDPEPMDDVPAALPAMSRSFSSYWPDLREMVNSQNQKWSVFSFGLDQQFPVGNNTLNQPEVREASKKASLQVLKIIQDKPDWLPGADEYESVIGQATACFRWYGMMIGPKFARIVGASGNEPHTVDPQTDLPTAKLLHLILARLIAATTIVMKDAPDSRNDLLALVKTYCQLLYYLRVNYPKAYLYQRTAFDNLRYAEEINRFYGGHLPIDPFRDNSWAAGGRAPEE